jgi:folate-binding protein YgfZ
MQASPCFEHRANRDDHLQALIEIRGNDSQEFLQGQLTQDVAELDAAISLPAAWCNAKGRVITLMRLLALQDSIGLVVPASLVDAIVQRLMMYRLRSDVSIEKSDQEWTCIAVSGAEDLERLDRAGLLPDANAACSSKALIAVDYSDTDRFVEIYGFEEAIKKAGLTLEKPLSEEQHAAMKIRAGLAEITTENTEKYTPHMLNLDRLGAISFDKGCYTGQEVVARTEHLGESKRRLRRYRCDAPGIEVGDKLSDGEREIGTVVNVQGTELLAVTPVALHERALRIDGFTVTPLK